MSVVQRLNSFWSKPIRPTDVLVDTEQGKRLVVTESTKHNIDQMSVGQMFFDRKAWDTCINYIVADAARLD